MGVAIRDTEYPLALQLTWEDPDELSDQLSPHNSGALSYKVYAEMNMSTPFNIMVYPVLQHVLYTVWESICT